MKVYLKNHMLVRETKTWIEYSHKAGTTLHYRRLANYLNIYPTSKVAIRQFIAMSLSGTPFGGSGVPPDYQDVVIRTPQSTYGFILE